jgi:hypothetical protein
MSIIKETPNVIFPFAVVSLSGENGIILGGRYDLRGARHPWDKNNPVQVTESTATSFTFLTGPGHFRGQGHTITFKTFERDGTLYLQQSGTQSFGPIQMLNTIGAKAAWEVQAHNLRVSLYGGHRADFPGFCPE